eukprot:TRINITY_DN3860_c0_g1_i1.p1 TRINITY_DN3860_c0_g1~~TRINITY_DN3860_c0_g1_i1.p1  ORF type:complete len:484 (+),score=42.83 TRINITY_DN3860_c0_g1_i1:485-1936(+)
METRSRARARRNASIRQSADHINALPDPLFDLIFSSLPIKSSHWLVSPRWLRYGQETCTTLRIGGGPTGTVTSSATSADFCRRVALYPNLTTIDISTAFLKKQEFLATLNDKMVLAIASSCPSLQTLALAAPSRSSITKVAFATLFQRCQRLTDLRMMKGASLTKAFLAALSSPSQYFKNLEVLHITIDGQYCNQPVSMKHLGRLRELLIGGTCDSVPLVLSDLDALTHLQFECRKLSSLPSSVVTLRGLKNLVIKCPYLRRLNFPRGMTFLHIESHVLYDLPQRVDYLVELTYLSLSCPPLFCFNFASIPFNALTSLKLETTLQSLPSFSQLTALVHLELHCCCVQELPPSILLLGSLETLVLECPVLSSLPERFGELTSLNYLHIWCYSLQSLPASLGNLSALRSLFLYSRVLTVLPPTLGDLQALAHLFVECESLESLPPSIKSLTRLESIRIRSNKLPCLPPSIGDLQTSASCPSVVHP